MRRWLLTVGALVAISTAPCSAQDAQTDADGPIPVELVETEQGWSLLRGGQPYFIKGAGGDGDIDLLAAAGANSIRTWGSDDIGPLLDAAHERGLTVTVGIWLGHERHGFDYNDKSLVAEQLQRVRDTVLRYRDHPAVLLWGIGNEMEGFEAGDNPRIWAAVNEAASLVKTLDPNHPTMTVTADIGGERVRYVHEVASAIDIHGINSYGGSTSLPQRLADAGATKPYIVTEFGPPGTWETATTEWGAPFELTSTKKAAAYTRSYRLGILENPKHALGGYVFLWSHKVEGTSTWFGMFLPDGARLAAVEAMTALWGGAPAANRAPAISEVTVDGDVSVAPGTQLAARVAVTDADEDDVAVRWVLLPETGDYLTGGDLRTQPIPVDGAIVSSDGGSVVVAMPEEPGGYRLFAYADDGQGNAATANVPLRVEGEVRTRMPVYVYEDSFEAMPWAPSGWMGNTEALTLDDRDSSNPYSGEHALRFRYEGTYGWVAVAWQNPANNWGDIDGGYDLTGARALEVWARGAWGGETVKFGVGLLGTDRPYPDSAIVEVDNITLSDSWQRYEVPLDGKDLSSLSVGFVVALTGRRSPVTIYVDRVRFVR
ncbi:MAG: glycoside hydrolase family 2 TIM barrel-domain containing protein [Pseudomonadota bacterium]